MGGLQAVRAPSFPANAVLITRLDNLSIYWQEDTRRRSVIDNPKRDRIENFESVNEGMWWRITAAWHLWKTSPSATSAPVPE
jgi:hypothetical protein